MVYLLGMSHAINVLRALSAQPLAASLDNWNTFNAAETFFSLQPKPGVIPDDRLEALIVSNQGWGGIAELRPMPDGKKQVVAADGFVRLLSSLENIQEGNCFISFLNGNEHAALSLLQHPVPYDFQLPGREWLGMQPGFQPLPYAVIRRQLEPYLNSTVATLSMMRLMLPGIRLIHVFPPPPIESEAQIRSGPEVFREQLQHHGVTPLSIRLKYYLLAQDIVREGLAGLRVELLDCPVQSIGESGGLLDRYAAGATHANEAYGALVVQQIQDLLNAGRQ